MVLPGLENRSLGDPYMMKYRGYYYLYVSAGDRNIYCWRTKDLMEWSEPFICCTDETTAVAYAPEVIYWNGLFYMCTSPRGGGHYLLTSESPTGPFTHQTGNLGRDIDGSMFVNDDGKWYFYHANNGGIRGCTMPTHLSFGNDVDLGCCISGQWTEGPCLFKRNGLFYLLYTGNHVWRGVAAPHIMADDFELGFSNEWGYKEGNWNIIDGQLESTGRYGKMLMGGFDDIHLTDYTVECDVIYGSGGTNGGLLFRTTNASTGGADDNPVLGTDFLQGYVFLASGSSSTLGKHNYGWQALSTVSHNIDLSQPHHMKVEVEGATIRCYLDDMDKPLITYTDAMPFITGRAGFRTHDSVLRFDNFKVTPASCNSTDIKSPYTGSSPSTHVRYYNMQGQPVSAAAAQNGGMYLRVQGSESRIIAVPTR